MSDINKYRKGYEDMKAEIEKVRHEDPILDLPGRAIKGLNPANLARDFFRSEDEKKGRRDALDGKEFDPSDEE